jgi:uncharacterized protein
MSALESIFGSAVEEGSARTVVESFHDSGFIVNGTLMQGAVMLLGSSQLMWNVSELDDITWESLVALRMLKLKPGAAPLLLSIRATLLAAPQLQLCLSLVDRLFSS